MFGFEKWLDPLVVVSKLKDQYSDEMVFFHSSLIQHGFSRYSILAFNPSERIEGSSFSELKKKLIANIYMIFLR